MATLTVVTQGQTGGAATTATTAAVNVPAVADRELILLVLGNGAPAAPAGWTSISGGAFHAPSHTGPIAISAPGSTGPLGWIVYQVDGITPGPTSVTGALIGGTLTIPNPGSKVLLPIAVSAGATFTPAPAGSQTGAAWWNVTNAAQLSTYTGTAYAGFGFLWEAAVQAGGARHRSYRLTGHR